MQDIYIFFFCRYCDALLYGLRSTVAGFRKQQIKQDCLYRKMLDEDCQAALLRLFYCVLNSAPQAVLQLVILLHYKMRDPSNCLNLEKHIHAKKCDNSIFGKWFYTKGKVRWIVSGRFPKKCSVIFWKFLAKYSKIRSHSRGISDILEINKGKARRLHTYSTIEEGMAIYHFSSRKT